MLRGFRNLFITNLDVYLDISVNIHSYIDAGKLARGCAPVTHGFRLNIAGRLLSGVGEELPFGAENIQSNNKIKIKRDKNDLEIRGEILCGR